MSDYPKDWPGFASDQDMLCDHHDCRCEAARKLNMQGLTERAIEVHTDKRRVRCVRPADSNSADGRP